MTFDLPKILESKREFRRELAALPTIEKLRLLDALRERQLALGSAKLGAMRAGSSRPDPALCVSTSVVTDTVGRS